MITGTRGRSRVAAALLGSTAEAIVRHEEPPRAAGVLPGSEPAADLWGPGISPDPARYVAPVLAWPPCQASLPTCCRLPRARAPTRCRSPSLLDRLRAAIGQDLDIRSYGKEAEMADYGAPLVLMAIGLVLWMAVSATLAGISIQTIGVILFVAGLLWLLL